MAFRIFAGVVAVVLLGAYLVAPVWKLREVALGVVVAVGLAMMLVDFWQSLKSKDE